MLHRGLDHAEAATSVCGHLVAFYDQNEHLTSQVTQFVLPALTGAGAAILVATAEHRQQFVAELAQAGIDVELAQANGRLVVLDAAETLARFMPDGCAPDPTAFREVIGGLIDHVSAGRDEVRIYGEMVALLWADGNVQSAISLEGMWNDLGQAKRFTLLCGYPMDKVRQGGKAGPFLSICQHHTEVLPNEAFLADSHWAAQLGSFLRADPGTELTRDELDQVRGEFIASVVENLRTGLLQKGDNLLAEARKTLADLNGAIT